MTIEQKLETFNIPKANKELNFRNIRWLLRNLPIQNGQNPLLAEVMSELKNLMIKN